MLNWSKELCVKYTQYTQLSVWNVQWKFSSNFTKQISRNRLQFAFRLACVIRDRTEEWRMLRRLFIVQSHRQSNGNSVFCRPFNHHSEAQRPGQPTPPFTLRDAERLWEGHNRSIIQWPSTVEALKKAVLCSPIEVEGRWASTGKCTVSLRECMRRKSC